MARNSLVDKARKGRVLVQGGVPLAEAVVDPADPPIDILIKQEEYQKCWLLLPAKVRPVARLWSAGLSWGKIAARVGSTAGAVRMQMDRAFRRVKRRFGPAEGGGA
jgi:DNA-directed RNA polymerase specialized sigma24 family protein